MCYQHYHQCNYCGKDYNCEEPNYICSTINCDEDRNMCNSCRARLETELELELVENLEEFKNE